MSGLWNDRWVRMPAWSSWNVMRCTAARAYTALPAGITETMPPGSVCWHARRSRSLCGLPHRRQSSMLTIGRRASCRLYARTTFSRHPSLRHVALVFTIHNIAYQGLFPSETVPALDLNPDVFTVDGLEFWGQASFLKAGINFSDLVTTVSEGYARQIVTPEFGYGFEGIVAARGHALRGILNGIDAERWNPETDRFLPAHFSEGALEGKAASKRTLLERYGLDASEDRMRRPVVGMISRLVYQKGFDLLATVIDELPSLGATFVVLGTGEPQYEDMWRTAAARYPDTVGVKVGYDEALAHLVEGGADVFLMPSRYEPCGLNQMYSMRYGTVPVVRATGGLDDVVEQYDERTGHGTGFKFSAYTSSAMLDALRLALRVYGDCERWQSIQQEGMRRDYSWNASASAYVREYAALVRQKHGEAGGETHA